MEFAVGGHGEDPQWNSGEALGDAALAGEQSSSNSISSR